MKILLTTGIFPPEVGGPATYSALMQKELSKRGISVTILPFREVRHLPRWIRHFVFFCKVISLGRKMDLLYSQDPLSVGFPTMLASKLLGKPFIVRIAGDYAWEQATQRFQVTDSIDDFQKKTYGFQTELMRIIQKCTARMAHVVINPSQYFRNLVADWVPGKVNAMAIYNGIDFSEIAKNQTRYQPRTLISAGRLLPWKGFDTLIRVMARLPDWKLYIAGDGPERDRLEQLVKVSNIFGRVVFFGNIPRLDLLKKIQECEIFILNTTFESFSFQVVEAMYAGTPVITTNIGNLREIIEDGAEGVLVSPNNEQMIINAIEKIHNDKTFREQIIKNALKKSESFSIESTVEKTVEVMMNVVKNQNLVI